MIVNSVSLSGPTELDMSLEILFFVKQRKTFDQKIPMGQCYRIKTDDRIFVYGGHD